MSSPQMPHPDEEQLLRYADGELPARQARQIKRHLEACWQCRAELEELQKIVGDCVRYRKSVLQKHLPPPPAPWGDIYRHFADIDSSLDHVPLFDRLAQALALPARHWKKWAPAAVALAAIVGIVYQLRHAPSVQAAELLRKAMAAADTRAATTPHRIRIHTRSQTVTRAVGAGAEAGDLQSIQLLFQTAHYSWADPLSARSYAAWRDQLADKSDEVTTITDERAPERSCYQIRTVTGSGELVEATLKLRTEDLRPVEEKLQFRNQEWVEIDEVAEESTPPSVLAAAKAPSRTLPEIVPNPDHMRTTAPAATLGDELAVLVALHGVGADLGDPIEVTRADGQILVAGVGIDAARRQQIQEALGSRPNVVVRFSDPAEVTPGPEKKAPDTPVAADVLALQARVEKQAGGRAAFEQLSSRLLDMSETMMARAYALRRLAERFPRETEGELSSADRERLRNLHREHTAALVEQGAGMERLLTPVLAPLGGVATPRSGASSASWQPCTEELFRTARSVETLLAVMLGVAPGQGASRDLPSEVLSSLAQLRARAEECARIMAK